MSGRIGDFEGARTRKELRGKTVRERKLVVRNRWFAGVLATVVTAASVLTGYTPATAATCINQGGFEIDGDFDPGTCGGDDWSNVDHSFTTARGTYKVVNDNSNPASWEPGGAVPPKVDFTAVYTFAHVTGGHYYVDVAWEREKTTGTGGYVIEVTNAPKRVGNDVPQPDRSRGGAVFYITTQGSATTLLQTCVYASQATYPGVCAPGAGTGFAGAVSTEDVTTQTGVVPAGGFFEVGLDVTTLSGGLVVPGCPAAATATGYMRSFTGNDFGPTGNLKGWVAPADLTPPSTCGSLEIVKQDAHGAPLAGAQFEVTPNPITGSGSTTVTTSASGRFLFDGNATPDTYTVTETKAPAGYLLPDPVSQSVPVADRQTAKVTFVDPLGEASWLKNDQDGEPLAGATFTVTATGGAAAEDPWNLDANPIVVTDNAGRDVDPAGGAFRLVDLPAGTYSVVETAPPPGYQLDGAPQSITIDQTHQSVSLESAFVNTQLTGTVRLFKSWANAVQGDSAVLSISGPGVSDVVGHTSIATGTDGMDAVPATATATAGSTVTVGEQFGDNQVEYAASSPLCTGGDATVPVIDGAIQMPITGGTVTCVIANTGQFGTIVLHKTVRNLNGGSATADQWTLTAAGPAAISGSDSGSGVTGLAPVGTYNLSESGPAGYTLTGLTCTTNDGDPVDLSDATRPSITVGIGDAIDCTFTNTDLPAHLTLRKTVDETDAGGTVKSSDFTLTATPIIPPTPEGTVPVSGNGEDGVTDAAIPAGQYTLSETGPSGFVASTWTCVGGIVGPTDPLTHTAVLTIGVGESASCSITNTAIAPRLTLVKDLDHSAFTGAARASEWTVSATEQGGSSVVAGPGGSDSIVDQPVTVGTYDLGEDAIAPLLTQGYDLTSLVCTNGDETLDTSVANPVVTLGEGDDVTCTFTNTPTPARFTIEKVSDRGLRVMPGDTIGYTITITHDPTTSWPAEIAETDIDDLGSLEANATLVPNSLVADFGTPAIVGHQLLWGALDIGGGVPGDGIITIDFAYTVNQGAWGVDLPNAVIPGTQFTCEVRCTTDSKTPDVVIWKTVEITSGRVPGTTGEVVPEGGTLTYTLHARNTTTVDLPAGQTIEDDMTGVLAHAALGPLPAGLTFDGTDTLTWTLPAIGPGEEATTSFTVTVDAATTATTLVNVARPGTIGTCVETAELSCTVTNQQVPPTPVPPTPPAPEPLPMTGGTPPTAALILGALMVLAGAGATILGRRRSRRSERTPRP